MYLRISLCIRLIGFALLALGALESRPACAQITGAITGNIKGKVITAKQQAVYGATVVVGGVTTFTDVNGNYLAKLVPIGKQTLVASKAAHTTASMPVKVRAKETVTAYAITLAVAPGLQVTGVAANTDSVKIRYNAVAGAADYRVYDSKNPSNVKYAGIVHILAPYGYHFVTDAQGNPLIPDQTAPNTAAVTLPTVISTPATEIEMNGLTPGTPHHLVVEAVDQVGPVPQGCLYDIGNNASFARLCAMCMLGGNMGMTSDNLMSTNGQGDKNNRPKKIASAAVTVQTTGKASLPSTSAASQVLFETFDSATITPVGTPDPQNGINQFTMETPATDWEIRMEKADIIDSQMFVSDKHFMDILFDHGTPGGGSPLHVGHGVLSLSPVQTVDFSGGRVLHLTQEVDAHLKSRRWIDFRLTPADSPYLLFETNNRINRTDTDFMVVLGEDGISVVEHTGEQNPGGSSSPPITQSIVGAAGQGTYIDNCRPGLLTSGQQMTFPEWKNAGYQVGRGIDNRSRFDLFVSETHFAVYEDGVKITEHDLPVRLPFTSAKVYFSHYHYHSSLEVQEYLLYEPYETFWINTMPYSDERHWDNMGFEVLPATTDWSTLAGLMQPPAFK